MVEPMTNGNTGPYVGWSQSDREELGLLRTRLSVVEKGVTDISAALSALNAKFDKKGEIPWTALGVMLAFLTTVGALVYVPMRETQSDLKAAVAKLIDDRVNFVNYRDLDSRGARFREEFSRVVNNIEKMDAQIVGRAEQTERWRSIDQQIVNQQRQVDDIKKSFGDTFSLRDALIQMQRRIDMLESKTKTQS